MPIYFFIYIEKGFKFIVSDNNNKFYVLCLTRDIKVLCKNDDHITFKWCVYESRSFMHFQISLQFNFHVSMLGLE